MSALAVVLTLVLLAAVIAVVSRPLLATRKPDEQETPEHVDLEAAREAKYREIRDAELDYRTGKLSREDYEAVNGTLRADAVEILDRLEAHGEEDQRSVGGEDQGSGSPK
jgi:type II secretory pathway component PulM